MTEHKTETLAGHVRQLRQDRVWSQDQLAGAAGLSLRTVQRVENGFACSPDTVQALASAFDVEPASLSVLAPKGLHAATWLGIGATPAALIGVGFCLPAAFFIATNIAFYEFNLAWAEPLLPQGFANGLFAHPLILLGGPVIAIVLNAPHFFSLKARRTQGGELFEGVLISWNAMQVASLALAAALLSILLIYVAGENFLHLLEELINAQRIS